MASIDGGTAALKADHGGEVGFKMPILLFWTCDAGYYYL